MRRPPFPPSLRASSRGATLISLMVGLTLSMLVVAAMMLVLRNLAHTTGTARADAQADDRLVSSLLSAGLMLHEAGFQVDQPKLGTDLIVIKEAVLNEGKLTGTLLSSGKGNLVLWRQMLGSTIQCSGLLAPKEGGLKRLQGPACINAGDLSTWESLSWTEQVVTSRTDPDKATSDYALQISAADKTCTPFGIASPATHLQVTLEAPNSNMNTLTAVECLGNFVSSAPAPT